MYWPIATYIHTAIKSFINSLDWVGFEVSQRLGLRFDLNNTLILFSDPELNTLEWNILNSDRLINVEIDNKKRTSLI